MVETIAAFNEINFETQFSVQEQPYFQEHQIRGNVVFPLTGYLEMALAASLETFGVGQHTLTKIEVKEALILPERRVRKVRLILTPQQLSQHLTFQVLSQQADAEQTSEEWTLHIKGEIHYSPDSLISTKPTIVSLADIQARCSQQVSATEFYQSLQARDIEHGPSFQGVKKIYRCNGEALGQIQLPQSLEAETVFYNIHPAFLDACLQLLLAALPVESTESLNTATYLPVSLERVCIYCKPGNRIWSHAFLYPNAESNPETFEGDIRLLDPSGLIVAEILGVRLQQFDRKQQATQTNLNDWFYQLQWQPKTYLKTEQSKNQALLNQSNKWLIFSDVDSKLGQEITSFLHAHGQICVTVAPAENYKIGSQEEPFWINPERPEDYENLLRDALEPNKFSCCGVIYLWSLINAENTELSVTSLLRSQKLGAKGTLYLLQALGQVEWDQKAPKLWLVTRGTQSVTVAHEPIAIEQTPLWGLGKVIALEHPELFGGLIDLDPQASTDEASSLFQEIWQPDNENQLAFRQGQRYVLRLVSQNPLEQVTNQIQWHFNRTYIITGGMGGLGLQIARWMVEQGARHLLLLGATELPPRSCWNQAKADSPISKRIAAIQELESMGANVYPAAVDVADEAQLSSFLKQVHQAKWPPIRGVVHAAARLHDKTLLQLDTEAWEEVLRPKMLGGWLLHHLLKDIPLDFFVLFSSGASLLGLPGQGNYTAANAFLDGLAHYRQAQGQPALSINWGPWAEVGMAARADQIGRFALQAMDKIELKQGFKVLEHLFQKQLTQVGVLPINWLQWQQIYPQASQSPLLADLIRQKTHNQFITKQATDTGKLTRKDIMAVVPEERFSLLQAYCSEQVARVLRLPTSQLDLNVPLSHFGLDSLMAVELKNRFEADLEVAVPLMKFIEGDTTAQLATKILEQLIADTFKVEESVRAQQLLAQLDQLSNEEVDALLTTIL